MKPQLKKAIRAFRKALRLPSNDLDTRIKAFTELVEIRCAAALSESPDRAAKIVGLLRSPALQEELKSMHTWDDATVEQFLNSFY